jgi:hypothetical protein
MTTNQTIIFEGHIYDKLMCHLTSSPRIIEGSPDTLGVSVNVRFVPYRVDDTGSIIPCYQKAWSALYSDIATSLDMIALQTFGAIEAAIQNYVNQKNL